MWTWTTYHDDGFPMRDMVQEKSKVFVNGEESPEFINMLLADGQKIRAEFITKSYEESKERDYLPDFLPPET